MKKIRKKHDDHNNKFIIFSLAKFECVETRFKNDQKNKAQFQSYTSRNDLSDPIYKQTFLWKTRLHNAGVLRKQKTNYNFSVI